MGAIQLTGRTNYSKAAARSGIDLVGSPEQVLTPAIGAKVAADYWHACDLNDEADKDQITPITRAINGSAMLGLAELNGRFQRFARSGPPDSASLSVRALPDHDGHCHCGAIRIAFETEKPLAPAPASAASAAGTGRGRQRPEGGAMILNDGSRPLPLRLEGRRLSPLRPLRRLCRRHRRDRRQLRDAEPQRLRRPPPRSRCRAGFL